MRDLIERVFWTAVSAALGTIPAAQLSSAIFELDLAALETVAVAGLTAGLAAAANALLVIARARLAVLPDPGAGLPGLPVRGDR